MIRQISSNWSSLADRDKRSLIFLLVFVAVMGIYLGLIEPIYKKFEFYVQRKNELQQEIVQKHSGALSVYNRMAKLNEVRQESAYLVEKLNIENNGAHTLGEVLNEIKLYAKEAGIKIGQITPLEMQNKDEYQGLPFIVTTHGSFVDTSKFIYFLETSPQVFIISDIQMNGKNNNINTRLHLIKISTETVESDISDSYLNVLRIGLDYWIGYAPFYVAQKLGLLSSEEINIQLIHGEDSNELMQLIKSGDLDGLALPLSDQVAYMEQGFELKGVYPFAWSRGGDAIVVPENSDIKDLKDLNNIAIYGEGRFAKYIVYRAFKSQDLSYSLDSVYPMNISLVLQNLSTGLIQAGVLWEPYLSIFFQENSGKKLFTSQNMLNTFLEMLVIRDDVISKQQAAISFLLNALKKAQEWIKVHPEETYQILADQLHLQDLTVRQGFSKIHFLSPAEQRAFIGCTNNTLEVNNLLKEQEQFLRAIHQKKAVLPQDELFDWSILKSLTDCHSLQKKSQDKN